MRIAVPSNAPGGLDATIADHFGHCVAFTLVDLEGEGIGQVQVLDNLEHEHGGCMAPVMLLKQQGVDAMVAGGMGMRPLSGFQQVGIIVYFKENASTVREGVQLVLDGSARTFGDDQTCGGGGGGCGGHDHHHHHHHEPVEREPVVGLADVRADRVVTIDYKLTDAEGSTLDSSEGAEPLSYLHGHNNIVPGLETALEGLVVGDHKVVDVPMALAYGPRDEDAVIDAPRDQFPSHTHVGQVVQAKKPDGQMVLLMVVAVDDDTVRLDPNHPLAGKDLTFDITIRKVEQATAEELEHGHVH